MASPAYGNQIKKQIKKRVKKKHGGLLKIAIVFLMIGAAIGYLGTMYISQNDCFILNGETETTVSLGTPCTYIELGATVISLGRDLSDHVRVDHEFQSDENGNFIVDTTAERTYVITYTIDDIKYGEFQRIRTITVTGDH